MSDVPLNLDIHSTLQNSHYYCITYIDMYQIPLSGVLMSVHVNKTCTKFLSEKLNLTFVMVTKSRPRKTALTPSILNNSRARGDPRAEIGEGKSSVPVTLFKH